MNSAFFRFYGDLNDFLPGKWRESSFSYSFEETPSIKHLIEALGVPHTEVYNILVNQRPVDFYYLVKNGDQVEVFPISSAYDNHRGSLQPEFSGERRFILDNHLGRLAAYLRMLGFDVLYKNDYQDAELAEIASRESRILLTRDRHLLMRNAILYGYLVRSQDPKKQMPEVLHRYHLVNQIRPFQRCLRCNTLLIPVRKEDILNRLEPLTKIYFDEFHICPACGQIYWKGSHYERMQHLIQQAREDQSLE